MYHRALNKNGEFLSGAMEMEEMRSAGRRGAAGQGLCEGPFSVSCRKSKLLIPKTILDEAIARFRAQGRLSPEMIREMREWPYPWYTPTALDRWYVRHYVLCKKDLGPFSASSYWLAGHRCRAVMKCLTSSVGYRLIILGSRLAAWR